MALVRMGTWLRSRGGRRSSEQADFAVPVDAVLGSRTGYEVLHLHPSTAAGGAAAEAMAADRDMESGLTEGQAAEDISDNAVLEAFLQTSAGVHPFQNSHPEALLAFRWVVDIFVKLRERRERTSSGTQVFETSLREEVCATTSDEAQRVFAEVVSSAYDRLSLRNPEDCGLSKAGSDSLLKCLHILHLRPDARMQQGVNRAWTMLDTVLRATLIANWIVVSFVGKARMFSSVAQRQRSEFLASTTMAALGGIMFSGASRIQRIVSHDGVNATNSFGVNPLEPLVRCPLCREATPSSRAIQHVRAGDAAPMCCVCTEHSADVCLPCGHLCMCGDCFQHLPRTTAASG